MLDIATFRKQLPRDYFDPAQPIILTRAPGRLDVMGGVASYSGGLCLSWPLECTTFCALQRRDNRMIEVQSANAGEQGWAERVVASRAELTPPDYQTARAGLAAAPHQAWAKHVLGALVVLHLVGGAQFPRSFGARIFVASDVPPGAGVAASAALQVAAANALCALFEVRLDGHALARLCQKVETEVIGVPWGHADHLAVALGRKNHLTRILCQPDKLQGHAALPDGAMLFGIDSGVRPVDNTAYLRSRCAAFMGRRMLHDLLPGVLRGADGAEYLGNVPPDVWRAVRDALPAHITGTEFMQRFYRGHRDEATTVEPDITYAVRMATEHPVYESDRARRFVTLLRLAGENEKARQRLLAAAGDLMIQSHFSYEHRCGLGTPETDAIVRLAREQGPQAGILGARLTGRGAGGTVAILADRRANPDVRGTVHAIAAAYEKSSGHKPRVLAGSSDGARAFGAEEEIMHL